MNNKELAKFLNKKVKRIDESFEVKSNDSNIILYFKQRDYCWVENHEALVTTPRLKVIVTKCAIDQHLTEEEQLVVCGFKEFYKAYNQPKKYHIKMNDVFTTHGKKYVKFNTEYLTYEFDNDFETGTTQTKFTEEEIAEMPDEVKKGIECGFLLKEMVIDA